MIRHLSADYIMPVVGQPVPNGIVSIDDEGLIAGISGQHEAGQFKEPVERYRGIIVPGFVNSHCHLELSHMRGQIASHTGLIGFIKGILSNRSASDEVILQAMNDADSQMLENGIVAVGDISNNSLSRDIKRTSSIHYHTFVEFFGFDPEKAETVFAAALKVLSEFESLPASLAPHAPYSVSKNLFKLFQKNISGRSDITSLHNQESEEENRLYRYKTGGFIPLYEALGLDLDFFRPQARNSIQSVIPLFPMRQRILLVHNTFSSLKDIYFANRFNRDIHWCFCPNANLYIEGRLPRIDLFRAHDFNITIGTDSLASNDRLCVLSELKTIKARFPHITFPELLKWATINGASFLGIDGRYGSIEPGKRPGLNLISYTEGLEITENSEVRKLA